MEEKTGDKVFIEKEGKTRFIVDQQIGFNKVLEQIKKRFKVTVFNNKYDGERIILIEEEDKKE